jgi:hypothetical protein
MEIFLSREKQTDAAIKKACSLLHEAGKKLGSVVD